MTGKVFVSTSLTGKMEDMAAISTNILTNPFCIKMNSQPKEKNIICSRCYGIPAMKKYRNARIRYQENSELLSKTSLSEDQIPIFNNLYVRFNAHGELINLQHLKNLYKIAEKNPNVMFALWSKRKDIVRKLVPPKNVSLVYSEPKINRPKPKVPKRFDKVFVVYSKEYIAKNNIQINCGAKKCLRCGLCYRKGKPRIIREKLK